MMYMGGIYIYTPMKMSPCFKEYLWGGEKLKKEFGKTQAPGITAESWELACHKDGYSQVEGGLFGGKTIEELGKCDHDGFWGKKCPQDSFPLLVKLIDAKQDLSIQVHPSDQTALGELNESGKAEMWYIVDCEPQASIYFGFSRQVSSEEFLRRANDGTICEVLNKVPVFPGDVFYILPGTIHAIGAGIVIAEIQQNSNTTFRVYDYQRRGADGMLRPLHLERAAEVLNYEPILPHECRANCTMSFPGFVMEEMFSCKYFKAYSISVKTSVSLCCNGDSFQHLLCVEGTGQIIHGSKYYSFNKGDSFFMPAQLGNYEIEGECRILLAQI